MASATNNNNNNQDQNQNQNQQAVDYLVVSDTLNNIRDQLNNQFFNLSSNVELQLADLRKQISNEKAIGFELKKELNIHILYLNEFEKECNSKTNDLRQANNLFFKNQNQNQNIDDNIINNLINNITSRHHKFEEIFRNNNSNSNSNNKFIDDIISDNEKWRNDIFKLFKFIQTSPSNNEFNAILNELKQRTNDFKLISDNSNDVNMDNLISSSVQRHNDIVCDDNNVKNDNNNWDNQLNGIRDVQIDNKNQAIANNNAFKKELNGRNNDLKTFNNILNIQTNNNNKFQTKNQKKKEKLQIKSLQNQKQTDLILNVQKRHYQNENELQKNGKNNDNNLQNIINNDQTWKDQFDQTTDQIIQQ